VDSPQPDETPPSPPPAEAAQSKPEQEAAQRTPAVSPASSGDAGEDAADKVNVNSANFEELRNLGMSVTQTGRVLAFRERNQGFKSLDELDAIPGFPHDFLDTIKHRMTV
jgi:DNA uptake protein ComE-like DNA-binding protein